MDLLLYFKVKWFLFKEKREVRRRFPTFLPFERALARAYRFRNPYRICKEFLKNKGEEFPDAYGETPLPVLAAIARESHLSSEDVLVDLGCGRGRGTLFLSHLTGCQSIGIDWVPTFIDMARQIVATLPLPAHFRCEEIQTADFSKATLVFLYGTCLPDDLIHALIARWVYLSPQVRIITVSYPLSDYSPKFQTCKQFTARFPWGEGEIYFNRIEGIAKLPTPAKPRF
jgi:hypothetical protein